jgi:hypothetical protein
MNLENGKEFPLSLPVSGSAHFSSPPPRPASPPPPFLLGFGPSTSIRPAQRSPAAACAPSSSLQRLTGRPCVPASLPGGARQSDPSPTSSPARTRVRAQLPRAIRASSPFPVGLWPFKYFPRCPLFHQLTPSLSCRDNLAGICCRDPHHKQFAAVSRLGRRERLADLLLALAKSPSRFVRVPLLPTGA